MLKATIKHLTPSKIAKQIAKHLSWINQRLNEADDDLDDAIRHSPLWQAKANLMMSIPCVGRVTATSLLAAPPEFGQFLRREISALAVFVHLTETAVFTEVDGYLGW